MPKGRKSVKTAMRFEKDREAVLGFLRSEVAEGSQAYIVLPLIEESEKLDLKAAKEYHALLCERLLPELRIGLLHGRMKEAEKDEIMRQFIARELDVLVSTTVIEVGVDVPNASLMIIEHADRFGLAQLHQLRGRVGRGERQSYCILMTGEGAYYAKPDGPEGKSGPSPARVRLDTMCNSTDGFRIAEVDLDLRGPGELWGTEQSGFPELKIADLAADVDILTEARSEAFAIIEADPHLRRPEHVALKSYLGTEFGARLLDASIG
jgi:ATP-dependent DNA helicase RecG